LKSSFLSSPISFIFSRVFIRFYQTFEDSSKELIFFSFFKVLTLEFSFVFSIILVNKTLSFNCNPDSKFRSFFCLVFIPIVFFVILNPLTFSNNIFSYLVFGFFPSIIAYPLKSSESNEELSLTFIWLFGMNFASEFKIFAFAS